MSDHPGLRLDEPMSRHVSWRAGGRARRFYQPADVPDLCAFLRTLPAGEPILFVGLGSNLLVRDGGFAGTVIFTHHALTGIEPGDAPRVWNSRRARACPRRTSRASWRSTAERARSSSPASPAPSAERSR